MKRVLLLLVAIVLMFSISLPALSEPLPPPPASDLSPNPDYFYGSWTAGISPMSTAIAISSVTYNISKASSTSVSVSASTTANQTADQVGGTMYLQQWNGTAWTNIKSRSFFAYVDDSDSDSTTWTVTSGYYYRLRTVHTASLDADTVNRTTYTGGILVN